MKDSFKWQEIKTEYREIRGRELRWLINRETIANRETEETITRSIMRHPGICVIVPFLGDDQILLMHQYRFAADEALWELPAGTIEGHEVDARMVQNETPAAAAARELEEETGYRAGLVEQVGECYAMPGISDELIYVFFAHELTKGEQALEAGEIIDEITPFSTAEIKAMIASKEIRDAKTLVGLFYALYATDLKRAV